MIAATGGQLFWAVGLAELAELVEWALAERGPLEGLFAPLGLQERFEHLELLHCSEQQAAFDCLGPLIAFDCFEHLEHSIALGYFEHLRPLDYFSRHH